MHDLGEVKASCPVDLVVTYSSHYCSNCRKYFKVDPSDVASPGSHYTRRVRQLAVHLVAEDGLPYRSASWHLWRDHRVFVPFGTIQNWVEAGRKKAHGHMHGAFLDGALASFSGDGAADELYEGPYCVLSAVDNRQYKRILYDVLDHDPTHEALTALLERLKTALTDHDLVLQGITPMARPSIPSRSTRCLARCRIRFARSMSSRS